MSANIYHPSRGGVRGGKDQFNWEDVKSDKDRENYLGHSLKAPVGRWQKGKDIMWYTKDKEDGISADERRKKELQSIKDLEAHAMAAALGHKVPTNPVPQAEDMAQNITKGPEEQRDNDSKSQSKRKKEKSKKKAKKNKRKYESSENEDGGRDFDARAARRNDDSDIEYGYSSKMKRPSTRDGKDSRTRDRDDGYRRRRDDYEKHKRDKERYTRSRRSRSADGSGGERRHKYEKGNRQTR